MSGIAACSEVVLQSPAWALRTGRWGKGNGAAIAAPWNRKCGSPTKGWETRTSGQGLLLGVIQNILTLSQVASFWIDASFGAIILLALILTRVTGQEAAEN